MILSILQRRRHGYEKAIFAVPLPGINQILPEDVSRCRAHYGPGRIVGHDHAETRARIACVAHPARNGDAVSLIVIALVGWSRLTTPGCQTNVVKADGIGRGISCPSI